MLGAGPLAAGPRDDAARSSLRPSSAAAALTFLFCFTSFGVILILGGPGRATLETEIYNRAARLFDLQAAAALSLLQLGAVAARAGRRERPRGAGRRRGHPRPTRATCSAGRAGASGSPSSCVLAAAALVLVLPLAVLVRRSLGSWGALFAGDAGAARRAVAGGRLLRRLRERRRADRARRRRPRRARARAAPDRAPSTGSSCCRSAPRR